MPDYGDSGGFQGAGSGEAATGGSDGGSGYRGGGRLEDADARVAAQQAAQEAAAREAAQQAAQQQAAQQAAARQAAEQARQAAQARQQAEDFRAKEAMRAASQGMQQAQAQTQASPSSARDRLDQFGITALQTALAPTQVEFDEFGFEMPDELSTETPMGKAPMSKSEYEALMDITETNPYGKSNMSTAFGRGLRKGIEDIFGRVRVDYGLDQKTRDFIANRAYDKYTNPYTEEQVLTTMKSYNLTPEEQQEFDRQKALQQTDTPKEVISANEYRSRIGEPIREVPEFTLNPGLSVGDLTQFGTVASRARDLSPTEIGVRLGLAATPLGLPLGIMSQVTDMDKVLGIPGMPDPVTGKPFQPDQRPGFIGQAFDLMTAGVGTTALSEASDLAKGLLESETKSGPDRFGADRGDVDGDGPPERPLENIDAITDPTSPSPPPSEDVINRLFGQERYKGIEGAIEFDPYKYLPELRPKRPPDINLDDFTGGDETLRARPGNFGIAGYPTGKTLLGIPYG